MSGMRFAPVVAVALLLATASHVADAGRGGHGRDLTMKKSLCMWLAEAQACVADIFGNVQNKQVLAETKALEECPAQVNQEACEKTKNCFWNNMQQTCITDVTTLNSECYVDEWNTIQRTFQCPQFGTQKKCTGGLPSCVWDNNACAIDDDAVQAAVKSNDTIADELDQFQACRDAVDTCEAPCLQDPTLGCLYNDLFNPLRFVKETPSTYCQLQIARHECSRSTNCTQAPDCFSTEIGDCIITPEAIVKFALADDPKASKKLTKAISTCETFATEADCLAYK